jgi:hypothetical protein
LNSFYYANSILISNRKHGSHTISIEAFDPIIILLTTGHPKIPWQRINQFFPNDQLSQKYDRFGALKQICVCFSGSFVTKFSSFRYNWPKVKDFVAFFPVLGGNEALLQSYQSA